MKENSVILSAAQAQGVSSPTERTGMHTTALVVKVGEHIAILYYSSRRHAGENLQGLLDKREAGLAKPLAMSDALTSNAVADESRLIRCHCLAHGRRKFSDLEDVFPQACQVVLRVLSQVFDHDEQARQAQLSPPGPPGVPPSAEPTIDGRSQNVARQAAGRASGGAQQLVGEGHRLYADALGNVDAIFIRARCAARQ
jgi:hypothetical protein